MSLGRILFIDQPHPLLHEELERKGFECIYELEKSKTDLKLDLDQYVGLVCRSRFNIDADFLQNGTNLKFIARAGVGVEHIDVLFAEKMGILVLTSPEGSADAVAEHTVGMMLGLQNHLFRAYAQVRSGQWLRTENTGFELKGKTVGILGYGKMGKAFAKRLVGFECEVVAFDRFKSKYQDDLVIEMDLEAFHKQVDILSIHANYIPGNYHYIDHNFIHAFSKNIWIINTARGLLVDTDAVVKALKSGKVQGAALDVLEYEEVSFANMKLNDLPESFKYLQKAPNVVLTPHIAGWSEESYLGHSKVLYEKIIRLFKQN